MGVLRVLLAVAVLFAHTSISGALTGGTVAVQAFYIISGFYMALILDTTYRDARLFYGNRLLRLMPTYWLVAGLTLLAFVAARPGWFRELASLPPVASAFLIATNALLFLQDLTMFLGTDGASVYLTSDFNASTPPLYHFLLVPQAWTLGLELMFYLLAPMILRWRSAYLVGIVALSIAFRLLMWRLGFDADPWTYRFFPFEIALFVSGSLAYRAYRRYGPRITALPRRIPRIAMLAVWSLVLAYAYVPVPAVPKAVAFYVILTALLPLIFQATRDSALDRAIGELSYPTYLVHVLVLGTLSIALRGWPSLTGGVSGALFGCVATLAVAFAIHKFIEVPVEIIRTRRKRRAALGRVEGAANEPLAPAGYAGTERRMPTP